MTLNHLKSPKIHKNAQNRSKRGVYFAFYGSPRAKKYAGYRVSETQGGALKQREEQKQASENSKKFKPTKSLKERKVSLNETQGGALKQREEQKQASENSKKFKPTKSQKERKVSLSETQGGALKQNKMSFC